MKKIWFPLLILTILILFVVFVANNSNPVDSKFDGKRAYQDVLTQVNYGPRIPGSQAHSDTVHYITTELKKAGWKVELQQTSFLEHNITNIIANKGKGSRILLVGAHYDSRMLADQDADPELATMPVPGANDGASGVAVLLEIARVLNVHPDTKVTLVFFDAEDQGRLSGWDWILGSRAYVSSLKVHPDAVVIIDMIGDKDLNVYREANSDPVVTTELWTIARNLGHANKIIDEQKHSILDDHMPFLEAGIPAVDIIDFDYPYWHTNQDTPDKVSPESLQVIGDILIKWLSGSIP